MSPYAHRFLGRWPSVVSKTAKRIARSVGGLLALASVVWIVNRFVQTGVLGQLSGSRYFERLVGYVAFAVPLYAAGLCFAGLAWCCLQTAFLPVRPSLRTLFGTYATTQFAKYLPGNVGHYIGRHVLLRRLGMNHWALLMASLGEAGFLVLASLVWAASAMKVLFPWLHVSLVAWQVLAVECVCLALAFVCLQWLRARHSRVHAWVPLHKPAWLLPVLPLQLMLFAIMALALMAPAHVLLNNADDIWLLPATAAASWMAGFLVLGAPAGLGVREMVFLTLLHGHMPEPDILVLAAAFRLITFGGDLVVLLVGLLLRSRPTASPRELTGAID